MNPIGKQITIGAGWMVGMRFIDRGVGFISTLILARLLLPQDFGLVAMAMTVFGFVEIGGQFGFDVALIRDRQASRAHYDSAWTLSVGYGFFTALALTALAIPSAAYFNEPRLQAVFYALAVIALIQGFENIGIIDFRKHLNFQKDFQLVFTKRIISFFVTLALAYTLRSYWALLGGVATSRIAGVILSYRLHPYRPRFDRSETRGLLVFSRWIVLRSIVDYFLDRGPDFLIGRFLNANALGLYRVSCEISTLPTTELIFPIMRAVYPGYAAIAHDRNKLASSFLMAQGTIVMLTLPAGISIVLLADPIVKLLLGPNWLAAIPLIQILGLYGAVTVFQATNMSIFNVLGKPQWGAALKGTEVLILLPSMFMLFSRGYDLVGAAWLVFGVHALMIPTGVLLIGRLLDIGFRDRLAVAWRPALATAIIAAMLEWISYVAGPAASASAAALQLVVSVFIGVIVFILTMFILWKMSGMPNGPEKMLLAILQEKLTGGNHAKI